MPGPTLPNTGITLPTIGGDAGVWDEENNDCWSNYDEHDHKAGNGMPITSAAITVDGDINWGGFSITHLGKVDFDPIAPPGAGATVLYVSNVDNELYWLTNAGAAVKLTNGASINTTLLGGIVGDYAAVGAEVAYDDANDRYTFKQQGAPKTWARLASGDVRIYETGTNENVYVGFKAPTALAASIDITLPISLPANNTTLKLDAAGNLSTAGLSIVIPIAASSYHSHSGDGGNARGTHAFHTDGYWNMPTAAGDRATARLFASLPVIEGDVITAWSIGSFKASSNANTLEARLYKVSGTNTVATQVGATAQDAGNATGAGALAGTTALPVTVGVGEQFYIEISQTAAAPTASDRIHATKVTITRANG